MKKLIKSYTSFTRTERMGFIVLSALLLIFILVRATMHLWVHPAIDTEKEKKLVVAWETFKRSQPKISSDTTEDTNDYQDAYDESETPLPYIININTADSATLVRLKGIGPATASKIIAYRNANGPFNSIEQLLEMHFISKTTFGILCKHICVDTVANAGKN